MGSGQKILLVEDDEALRTSLSEQLHLHEEFETHTATTGAEALDAGKKGHPPGMKNPFRYFNSSPEVIRLTVMMYVRYR